jgi:hypothetical protein
MIGEGREGGEEEEGGLSGVGLIFFWKGFALALVTSYDVRGATFSSSRRDWSVVGGLRLVSFGIMGNVMDTSKTGTGDLITIVLFVSWSVTL